MFQYAQNQQVIEGTLICKPISAKITHDTDWFTKMTPYVVFTLGTRKGKSRISRGGGKTPTWSDSIALHRSNEDMLYIEIWDDETFGRNELIAVGEVPIAKIFNSYGHHINEWVNVFYQQRPAGHLNLDLTFQPTNQIIDISLNTGFPQQQSFGFPQQQQSFGFPQQQQSFGFQQQQPFIQQQPMMQQPMMQQPMMQQPMMQQPIMQQPMMQQPMMQQPMMQQPLQTTTIIQQPLMQQPGGFMIPQPTMMMPQQTMMPQPMMQQQVGFGMMPTQVEIIPMQTNMMPGMNMGMNMGMPMQQQQYGMPNETIVILEENHHHKKHHHHNQNEFW